MPLLLLGLALVVVVAASRASASSGGGGGGGGAIVACPTDVPASVWAPVTLEPYKDSNAVSWDLANAQVGNMGFVRATAKTGPYTGHCIAASIPMTASGAEASATGGRLRDAIEAYAVAHKFSK